jgi:cobalt/nickel transport system permease protein
MEESHKMSHLHIPDGILPFWLWFSGIIAVVIYLIFLSIHLRKQDKNKKTVLIGVFSALMILAMSIEIVPISYHVNLSALTGMILGPIYAPLAILVSNLFLAFMGHGGITVVCLNALSVSAEAILAFYLFRLLNKKFKTYTSAFISTFLSLIVSALISIMITYAGTGHLEAEHHHENENPNSIVRFEGAEKDHNEEAAHEEHDEHEEGFDIKRFALLIAMFGTVGWTLEALLTAFVVNYINKVKPEILEN